MNFSDFWNTIKIRKWGKYVLTLLVFGVVYVFVGDQSLIMFAKRGGEIRRNEQQRDMYRKSALEKQRQIQNLNNLDSLEKFARENYYMHTSNEDIFLVEEE